MKLLLVLIGTNGVLRAADDAPATLARLIDESWQFQLREDPLFATQAGDHRYDDRLPELTLADIERRAKATRDFADRLKAIARSKLVPADQINYDILARQLDDRLAEYRFKGYLLPITNRSGFHVEFPELPREVPLETVRDFENYAARLAAFGRYADQHIALMRSGLAEGYTLPAEVLRGYEEPLEAQIVDDPARSLLAAPLEKFPERIEPDERQRLSKLALAAIAESVVPGYRRFLAFMRDEYVPKARDTVGAWALPDGRDYYRYRVRHFATLDVSPGEVHATGQAEVKRIRGEMQQVIERVKFPGDFAAFVEHLRTDPKFYADTPEQLMKETGLVLKRIDGELPKLFGKLPRTPYGIREIPAYIAPQTTTAYYFPPAGDGTRAGFYYVNTSNLKSRPLYEIEALSLHEAVPGHHLQIALAQELTGVPAFRRFTGFTAFVEGWGLYSERLGLEMGFYGDPYSDFGRLSYEMWRACRLVVDTGMHDLGWSRQQAIDFMAENSALTLHNISTEVDRYIGWPGQAVAYKLGELKLRELRRTAEAKLGARFDVREFHDVVLSEGAIPLDALERHVNDWLARKSASAAAN
ncbi:MAG: DUF885 domain-containing protein [Pirellulales bacterium]|nr:DUF885 domain-containing protein [Pirellulales bacterium]